MKVLGGARVVDALGEWGVHEGLGRGRDQYPAALFQGPDRLLNGVEVALTFRSPLSWRIIRGWPLACLRVEFEPADTPLLHIADGRTAETWTDAVVG